ncbi:hypothetical protein PMAYCL1PPCAC_11874 [Pristionchus mayeri]|uniref:Uncharacterized protein n=1 Tax=Pristionchus mayeri TaxID=1317129 RepID=A0AAN4ZKR1_9BILA|nr:hypothetical protein PMAYCL1PPCAC_11874 [Pristionchus mayeri]
MNKSAANRDLTLEEELDLIQQCSSNESEFKQQLRSKLEEAMKKISELAEAKSRLEYDLRHAKRNIEAKEADLVRAHEEIRLTTEAADQQRREAQECRYEMDRMRDDHRNYVIENEYLRKKEVEDETPRVVLSLMRNGRKRSPLTFPLHEDHPHYPYVLKKPRSQ